MKVKLVDNALLIPAIGEKLREGYTITLTVKGRSMNPMVRDGRDKATIVRADSIKLGDTLLAKVDDGHYVLHRLIRVSGDRLTLKGDGNLRGEETCCSGDVVGKASEFIRPSGRRLNTEGLYWKTYSWIWMHTGYWVHRGVLGVMHRILKLK